MRAAVIVAVLFCIAGCTTAPMPAAPGDNDTVSVQAATPAAVPAVDTPCADDADWDAPATPRRVHGGTWYVGTCGIVALLVTSDAGHVLVDSGTETAAPQVLANIQALGFRVQDVRYIVNSHAHHDHAGGIAAIQRASGATVVAMPDALSALRTGHGMSGDPQHGALPAYPGVGRTRAIRDGDVLRMGPLALTAHATPGHAPGGTSWTWRSCERDECLDIVYADSLSAVAAQGYRFGDPANADVVATLRRSFDRVADLPCDLLITPHPQASGLWSRLGPGATKPLASPGACRVYADAARSRLVARLADEPAAP